MNRPAAEEGKGEDEGDQDHHAEEVEEPLGDHNAIGFGWERFFHGGYFAFSTFTGSGR